MHDAALLIVRLPGLQRLRGLLADSELELALQDIAGDRTCVPVRTGTPARLGYRR
jgi:hypothetical protein